MNITAKFMTEELSTVSVTIHNEDGTEQNKRISFDNFVEIINASQVTNDFLQIGNLPKGFWDGCLSVRNRSTFKAIVIVPEGNRLLNYYGEFFDVPFPKLVFQVNVVAGKVNNTNVFALKDENVTDKSMLYHYPYGNVYGDGRICWGSNYLGYLDDISQVDALVALFFGAETNDDLFSSKTYNTQRELILSVQGKTVFPEKQLERLSTKKLCDLL